jgi:hypothetical protein
MKRTYVMALAALLCCLSGQAAIAGKPVVGVDFTIAKQGYRDGFPDDIDGIESECTEHIIELLNQQFQFLDFQKMTGAGSLQITLDDKEPGSHHPMQETGFRVRIEDANAYWVFREDTQCHLPLGSRDAFADEVCAKFDPRASGKSDLLVGRVLSKVLIASEVLALKEDLKYWALPLKRGDSKIDYGSLFDIKVMLVLGEIGRIADKYVVEAKGECTKPDIDELFRGGLLAQALTRDRVNDPDASAQLEVQGLYIIKYVPYRDAPEAVATEETYKPEELEIGSR